MKGRREPRIAKVLRMKVRGVGRNGNSFIQETRTTDYQPERGTAWFSVLEQVRKAPIRQSLSWKGALRSFGVRSMHSELAFLGRRIRSQYSSHALPSCLES